MKNNKKILYSLIIIVVILALGVSAYKSKDIPRIEPSTYLEGSAEEIAENYVRANSVAGVEFNLKKDFDNGTFVKFYVIPTGKNAENMDEARIFLKKNSISYEVIGFGTAFPELEGKYPELEGQI